MTSTSILTSSELRVLLLEDTPADAELAERELRKAGIGFAALRVETREAFLAAIADFRPDIILGDYKLPDFDGLSALALLREKSPEVPFVFVSGTMGEELAIETLHQGAADYVLKAHLAKLAPAVIRALKVAEDRRLRRLAEEALFNSRQMLRTVLDTIPQRVFWKDRNSVYLGCNKSLAEDCGFADPADVVGKTDFDLATATMAEHARIDDRQVLETGQPQLNCEELRSRPDGSNGWLLTSRVPVLDKDGEVIAILGTYEDITERKASEERTRFLAYHDDLTELPNRMLAYDRLQQAISHADREQTEVALLFLDVDNFKTINDSLGHSLGDKLLKAIAARLGECVRDTDTVSRHGGDEFLIILPSIANSDATVPFLTKLLERVQHPFEVDGHELITSISIGVALFPGDGRNFESLMKKADTAMYRAKEMGRNTYSFFDKQMNDDAIEHLHMRNGLNRAVERGEFVLHYQPQIDLVSGAMVGVEALIRWKHPQLGMVPPVRFIPVAEESGLIVSIGEWVVREACRQAAEWQSQGLPRFVVAVNLSAVQFKRGDVERTVVGALQESGLDPSLLELELTESILIRDTERVLATVTRLKALGITLSIDDFGTGYSSLSYLKRFNVDKLKIDRSFIRDLATDRDDAAIVRAVIQMARSLGLRTIAEGVEDEALLNLLRIYHCDEAQGYHFARPMPAAELTAFVARRCDCLQSSAVVE